MRPAVYRIFAGGHPFEPVSGFDQDRRWDEAATEKAMIDYKLGTRFFVHGEIGEPQQNRRLKYRTDEIQPRQY